MTRVWHFREKRKGDDISDPIGGEFFADGSLGENPATSLVREALQNALDAGKGVDRQGAPVRVRIGVYDGALAASPTAASEWFESLWGHVGATGNGLRFPPKIDESCAHIVIEDFGTTGLTGDTESDAADGERNNFVDFVRSDARTRKSEGDKGSWGVGKNVFPRSSRINGYIAYTVRSDDSRKLVIGKAIFKIRRVGGAQYQPACYLCESWKPDDVPRPYESSDALEDLRSNFHVTRTNETGLSLVIPWPDTELTADGIRKAVLEQFYFAILSNSLEVCISDGENETNISSETLPAILRSHLPNYVEVADLASWAMHLPVSEMETLDSPPAEASRWSSELMPDDVRDRLKLKLTQNQRFAIRCPLFVQSAEDPKPVLTHLDIFAEYQSGDALLRPAFFREQLAISGVKRGVGVPKIRALVSVNDRPLAGLLRAAEPPNHTDWDPKTANFRRDYQNGNAAITFVKTAVKNLISLLRAGDDAPDPNVTIDFFALAETPEQPSPPGKPKKQPGDKEPSKPLEKLEAKPLGFSIRRIAGGFVITPTPNAEVRPERLRIDIAYDVFSGSPWKRFEPADFDLTRAVDFGIEIEVGPDGEHEIIGPNCVEVEIGGPDFLTRVCGFDKNRDLIVRAYDPKESHDVDSTIELHEEVEADE